MRKILGVITFLILFKIAWCSDIKNVITYYKPHSNSQYLDKKSITIQNASEEGDIKAVKNLLAEGVDVNQRDLRGKTPLMYAASKNRIDVVKLLLDNGANVNAKDNWGNTVLMETESTNIVKFLINKGANLNTRNDDGDTAIMKSAREGNTDIVWILLQHNIDLNLRNNNGETALIFAASREYYITKILVDCGADVNIKDYSGKTALMRATNSGKIEIVSLLLDRGADINAKDSKYNNALKMAIEKGYNNIVKLLLDKGALLDKGTLMAAAQGGHADTFIFLVKRGARLDSEIIFTFLIVQIEKNVLWMLILLFLLIGLLFRKKIIKKVEAQKAEVLSSDSKKEIKSQENL